MRRHRSFFSDPPHIIKLIRNNPLDSVIALGNDDTFTDDHIREMITKRKIE